MRAATGRLLGGRPERTDCALTVSNMAREAGVSPATANRAVVLLAELRVVRGAEIAQLRGLARPFAQHIQVLTLQVAGRHAVIEGLQRELERSGDARVAPLKRSPRDNAGCERRIFRGRSGRRSWSCLLQLTRRGRARV